MRLYYFKHALFFVGLLLFSASFLFAYNTKIMNNFYSFSYCTNRDLAWPSVQSQDKHVHDRMNYYGYYSGFEAENQLQDAGEDAAFESATTITAFWNAYSDMIVRWGKMLRGESPYADYGPLYSSKHSRYTRMNKKILVCWDCFRGIPWVINSLYNVSGGGDTLGVAISFVAKYMAATDSILRVQYPGCDSIIHQMEQEINTTWRANPVGTDSTSTYWWPSTIYPYGYFMHHAGGNQVAAYKFFFSVVDSIATVFKGLANTRSSTAVEYVYYNPFPKDTTNDRSMTPGFKAAMFDSLTHVDAFIIFPLTHTTAFWPEINAVRDSMLAHNNAPKRRLGLRYSWYNNVNTFSTSQQVKSLNDYIDYVPNADFLTFFNGGVLDGQYDTDTFIDASTHFDALSIWRDIHKLHFIDHFSDTFDTDVWWNQSGAVSFVDSTVKIFQNSYIQSDSTFRVPDPPMGGLTLTSHHRKRNEANYQGHNMRLVQDANNAIHFYTQRNYLHCYVTQGGVLTGERFETIGDGLNKYDIVYNKTYNYVRFYFNGAFKKQIDLTADFDNLKLKYEASYDAGTDTMAVDSCWITDQYNTAVPDVQIVDWDIDESGSYPTVRAIISCNNGSFEVSGRMERICPECTNTVQDSLEFYNSNGLVTMDTLTFTFGNPSAFDNKTYWYRMRITVNDNEHIYPNSFYYDSTTSNVILSSAPEGQPRNGATLPRAFALEQNRPNPFNPSTTISYQIPEGREAVEVKLNVYDLRGRLIKRLVSSLPQSPGAYTVIWNGKDDCGKPVASGVYFYRLQAGDYTATRKMVMLK